MGGATFDGAPCALHLPQQAMSATTTGIAFVSRSFIRGILPHRMATEPPTIEFVRTSFLEG
jgi:hypothetical protein